MDIGYRPSLAADANGNVYRANDGGWPGWIWFCRSPDDGDNWDTHLQIGNPPYEHRKPLTMCDNSGGVYLVYMREDGTDYSLMYKYSNDYGTTWMPSQTGGYTILSSVPEMSNWYHAKLDESGFIHIVYGSNATGEMEAYYLKLDTQGNITIPSEILTPDDGNPSYPTGLTVVGGNVHVATRDYVIINQISVADAGPDQTVNEGDTVNFNGTGSFDPYGTDITYEWDFDADVDSDSDGNSTNDIDAIGVSPTHIYGDDGYYTVTLNVTNIYGQWGTDICNITVNNSAPIIDPFGPFTGYRGIPLQIGANTHDPGSDDLTFIWNWGDGAPDTITVHYNDGIAPDPFPSPWGTFPFSITDSVQHTYGCVGFYIINVTVMDDDGKMAYYQTNVTMYEITIMPPTLYINVSQDGKDAILHWDPPSVPAIKHYLIYRSTSQTDFDFNSVWVNTSADKESGEQNPIPLRTIWNDTNAAFPGNDTNYEEQYYYTVRTVNIFGMVSSTSRTVGKWTKAFPQGVSAFCLPLELLETMNTTVDYYLKDMNATYIKWMDPITHSWMKHGEGVINDTQMEVGEGYEVKLCNQTNYTFTGMPGAMISYDDDTGFIGFDSDTEAKNLTATVDPFTGNITLNWTKPSSICLNDRYHVLRSTARDGFWTGNYIQLANLSFDILSYTDICNATQGTQYYYMILPVNETGAKGASSYSLGVWTANYSEQYDTLGIPLKINNCQTADWYCDSIPGTVGMNFYNESTQRWSWHSKRMLEGAYDPFIEMTEGYQISTSNHTEFTFVGV
jgi:hypothetical protein